MLGYSLLQNDCYFRSTSLKWGLLNRKLYVIKNIKNCLHLKNPITNKSVEPYVQTENIYPVGNCKSLKICHF